MYFNELTKTLQNISETNLNEKNMSYCRFQNTLLDLRDCASVLEDLSSGNAEESLSDEEKHAALSLIDLCKEIAEINDAETIVNAKTADGVEGI